MSYPIGPAALPTTRGWRGAVIVDAPTGFTVGWECPHQHTYRDTSENCAGRAYRRWDRTGEKPE